MVTSRTYRKQPVFAQPVRRERLQRILLAEAGVLDWQLQAWCVLPNHYHVVLCSYHPTSIAAFVRNVHAKSARYVNHLDADLGRRVWYQYWDTEIRSDEDWAARMRYTMESAVKHEIVDDAKDYPFCSAALFYQSASAELAALINSASIEHLAIPE
jgi:putative transposase